MKKCQITLVVFLMIGLSVLYSFLFYVLFMTLRDDLLIHCLFMGIVFGIINAVIVLLFLKKYSHVKLMNEKLGREIATDKLTGLRSRRAFDNDIKSFDRNQKYAMVFMDVDNFRLFNETYGHQVGDKVLQKCGEIIKGSIRHSDYVYRYGGEEMVVILRDCGRAEAQKIGSTIVENIRSLENSPYSNITISAGVASMPDDADTFEQLIKASDMALLKAKKQGKDQVV